MFLFWLVIEDVNMLRLGLCHSFKANIITSSRSLPYLKKGGWGVERYFFRSKNVLFLVVVCYTIQKQNLRGYRQTQTYTIHITHEQTYRQLTDTTHDTHTHPHAHYTYTHPQSTLIHNTYCFSLLGLLDHDSKRFPNSTSHLYIKCKSDRNREAAG